MENRLVYKKGETPKTATETPEINDGGKARYLEIKQKLEKLSTADLRSEAKFKEIMEAIDGLYTDLQKSENGIASAYDGGNFFKELLGLLRDKFDILKIARGQMMQDLMTREQAQALCFLADPDQAALEFINANKGNLSEEDVARFKGLIENTAAFYVFQNVDVAVSYARDWFGVLHEEYEDLWSKGKITYMPNPEVDLTGGKAEQIPSAQSAKLRMQLAYLKDHFEFDALLTYEMFPKANREKVIRGIRKNAAELTRLALTGNFTADGKAFDSVIKEFENIETCKRVSTILVDAGLKAEGGTEKNDPLFYARPRIYQELTWAFYKGLLENPKATDAQRDLAHKTHNTVFEKYPQLAYGYKPEDERGKAGDEAAGEIVGEPKVTDRQKKHPKVKVPDRIINPDRPRDFSFWRSEAEDQESPYFADEGDESRESYEIPEVMNVQLNRVKVIGALAESLMGRAGKADKTYANGILNSLDRIEQSVSSYYLGEPLEAYRARGGGPLVNVDIVDGRLPAVYDGVTPFDLDGGIKADGTLNEFTRDLTRLLKTGPSYKVTKRPDRHGNEISTIVWTEDSRLGKFWASTIEGDDDDMDDVARKLDEWRKKRTAFAPALLKVLEGGAGISISTVKEAGAAVATFQRWVLDDYLSCRATICKFLEPHMKAARKEAEEDKALTGKLRSDALSAAIKLVNQFMDQGGETEFRAKVQFDYEQKHGRRMNDAQLNSAYKEYYNGVLDAQTNVIYQMRLSWHSVFKIDELANPAEEAMRNELKASMGGFGGNTDETVEFWDNFTKIGLEFLKEIAITMAACMVAGPAGLLVRGAFAGSRIAGFLLGASRFKTIMNASYLVMRTGLQLGTEAAVFLEVYGAMSDKADTLHTTLFEKGVWKSAKRLAGEMAMFGAFHGVSFLNSYFLRQGKAGKSMMAFALKEPKYGPMVEVLLAKGAIKDPAKAVSALKRALKHGVDVRLAGSRTVTREKLPDALAKEIRAAIQDVTQMQESYRFLLKGLPAGSKLRATGEYLILGMHFDVLAMLIGGAIKNGIYNEDMKGHAEMTVADTLLQAYAGAIAFRGAFTVVKRGQSWIRDRNGGGPDGGPLGERLPAVKSGIKATEGEIAARNAQVETQIAGIRGNARELNETAESMEAIAQQHPEGSQERLSLELEAGALRNQAKSLEASIPSLQARVAAEKKPLEDRLADLRSQETEIEADLRAPRQVGNFPVKSHLARIMPRRVRQALFRDYNVDGQFIGGDGMMSMALADFPRAIAIIEKAQYSIFSVNQLLVLGSKLPREQASKLLDICGKKMTASQKRYFKQMLEVMEIKAKDIPEHIIAETKPQERRYRDNPAGLERMRRGRFRKWLEAMVIAGAFSEAAIEASRVVERPAEVRVVEAKDFQPAPDSRFHIAETGEGSFSSMRPASKDSQVLVVKAGQEAHIHVKEWDAKKGFELLGQSQKSIFEALKQAGASESALAGMVNLYDSLPEVFQPHIRIAASVDGSNVMPYFVIDSERMESALGIAALDIAQNQDFDQLLAAEGFKTFEEFEAALKAIDPELATLLSNRDPEVLQAGFGLEIIVLLLLSTGAVGIGDLLSVAGSALGLAPSIIGMLVSNPLILMWLFRKRLWEWGKGRVSGSDSTETREVERGVKIQLEGDVKTEILAKTRRPAKLKEKLEYSDRANDIVSEQDRSFNEFYSKWKQIFEVDLRFTGRNDGRGSFETVIKWGYLNRRMKAIKALLAESNPLVTKESVAKMKRKAVTKITDAEVKAADDQVRADLQKELNDLRIARDGLKNSLTSILDSFRYITEQGRRELTQELEKELKQEMENEGFTDAQIREVRKAAVEFFNQLKNLGERLDKILKLRAAKKMLEPAYNKAKEITFETVGGTERQKPRPDATANPKAAAEYDSALKTVEAFKKIENELEGELRDMGKVKRKLSDGKRWIDTKPPLIRKAIYVLLAAAIGGAGVGIYQGGKAIKDAYFPPEPEPPKPPDAKDKAEAEDDEAERKAKEAEAEGGSNTIERNRAEARKAAEEAKRKAAPKVKAPQKAQPPVKEDAPETPPAVKRSGGLDQSDDYYEQ